MYDVTSLTITGLHVIQRISLYFNQCVVRKKLYLEIKLSNMHSCTLLTYILLITTKQRR